MKLEATFRPINASLFEACHATTQLGGIILKELAEYPQEDLSVRIIINTVSRVIRTTSSIFILCSIGDTQSGWILHRTLAERFFHLTHLSATNSYDDFEEWSFYEQANYQQKTASDPLFKGRLKDKSYFLTDDQKKRFELLNKSRPRWRRPRAADVAKKINLGFIYDYSYDYASTQIHPMANDVEIDNINPSEEKFSYDLHLEVLLKNSLLLTNMTL